MSKKLISSNDSESSKALFGTIIENQHIQSTVINDLSDRLDKMDTRIDSLDTDVDGSGDINTNNALIENDLSVKKDINDPVNVGYKTVLGDNMDLGVGIFESKFLRGLHQGAFSSSINAIYYDHWNFIQVPHPENNGTFVNNHVRLIHPEIKLAHPTPLAADITGSYNTFQIGPLGTSNIDSSGSEINGVNNNSFIVNLREQINNNNNNDNMLSVKMVSVCTQNDGPHISFENVSPDVNSSSEVAYIGAQVLTDSDGDQGSLVFKTLKTTALTNTNTGAITIESACEERLTINQHGAIGVFDADPLPTPSFGLPGAVFTSNGGWLPPTWTTPYYFGANLSTDQSLPNDNTFTINFVPYLPSPYNNNNDDMTNNVWTCPTTGLYKVSLRVLVAAEGDDIRSSDIYIVRNDGTTDFFEAGAKYFNNTNDDVQETTLNCETLIPITAGDTLTGRGRVVLSSGTVRTFKQTATAGGKATELIIVRII